MFTFYNISVKKQNKGKKTRASVYKNLYCCVKLKRVFNNQTFRAFILKSILRLQKLLSQEFLSFYKKLATCGDLSFS